MNRFFDKVDAERDRQAKELFDAKMKAQKEADEAELKMRQAQEIGRELVDYLDHTGVTHQKLWVPKKVGTILVPESKGIGGRYNTERMRPAHTIDKIRYELAGRARVLYQTYFYDDGQMGSDSEVAISDEGILFNPIGAKEDERKTENETPISSTGNIFGIKPLSGAESLVILESEILTQALVHLVDSGEQLRRERRLY